MRIFSVLAWISGRWVFYYINLIVVGVWMIWERERESRDGLRGFAVSEWRDVSDWNLHGAAHARGPQRKSEGTHRPWSPFENTHKDSKRKREEGSVPLSLSLNSSLSIPTSTSPCVRCGHLNRRSTARHINVLHRLHPFPLAEKDKRPRYTFWHPGSEKAKTLFVRV